MSVYPDALVVYTHRDPVVCIASSCSLSAETTAGHSTTYVGETIGRTQLDLWSRSFHAFHDARARYAPEQFVDVAFADLRRDPLGTVGDDPRAVRPGRGATRHARRPPRSTGSPRRARRRRRTATPWRTTGSPRTQVRAAFDRG